MSTAQIASTGGVASTGGAASTGGVSSGGGSTGVTGWGDDWRTRIAAGTTDPDKERKQLERYTSPEDIWKKARQFETRLSSGEFKTALKKDALPEEIERWRAENGVPQKPEEYKITMPAGRQPPKEDDSFLKAFLGTAHQANFTQPQVDAAVSAFYAEVDHQQQAITEAEKKAIQTADDQLRQEWGADYRVNKSMEEALLARAPAGFRDRFMNGYLVEKKADGTMTHTLIRAAPEAHKWLVQMEREINPAASVMPGAGGDLSKSIGDELKQYKAWMGAPKGSANYKKYWGDEKVQERYRELLGAELKMKERHAA